MIYTIHRGYTEYGKFNCRYAAFRGTAQECRRYLVRHLIQQQRGELEVRNSSGNRVTLGEEQSDVSDR